jgi:hypothetical protein
MQPLLNLSINQLKNSNMKQNTPTTVKVKGVCPVCESTDIRKDFDFPDMRVCLSCGSDFNVDGDVTLNTKTFQKEEVKGVFTLSQDGETLEFKGNETNCRKDYEDNRGVVIDGKFVDYGETFFDWCKNSYDYEEVKGVLHTPGELFLTIGLSSDDESIELINNAGEPVCVVLIHPVKETAQLIKSAVNNTAGKGINPEAVPELLEALKIITSELGEWLDASDDQFGREQNEAYQKAEAAIEKATKQ